MAAMRSNRIGKQFNERRGKNIKLNCVCDVQGCLFALHSVCLAWNCSRSCGAGC